MKIRKIGQHQLILGDCLEIAPSLKSVDAVVTDPPYEAILHEAKATGRRKLRVDEGVELREVDFPPIDEIRADVVQEFGRLSQGWFIAFCTPEGVGRWADVINASPIRCKRACTWVKTDAAPQMNGQGPAAGVEMFVTAWCATGYSKWNAGGKQGVYCQQCNPHDRHRGHPTEKPWRLMVSILQDFAPAGGAVLDPFMGSGATGIACIKTGRRFIGIEKDPKYFQMAVERMTAVHEAAQRQPDMFTPKVKERQTSLFGK